jgi:tetratricopeptide (TPR) repeat protein
MALNNLSLRLGRLDRQEEALAAVTEAVRIRRELLAAGRTETRPGLVAALNNLSIRLRALGRHEAAVTAAAEAVEQCRQLGDGSIHQFYLAQALNSLAIGLASVRRPDASAEAAAEAVQIYHRLRADQPGSYGRQLAATLTNWARAVGERDAEGSAALLREARELCDPAADRDLTDEIDELLAAYGTAQPG